MKAPLLPIILTGLTLGTTWAIRGQFGHEQGAAWAGGIACLFLIVFAKRKAWISGGFKASLLGAIGWGLGGMMSYGLVVGYARNGDFLNVSYGLMMLFVIGGLYGFLGGGLFGLGLQESGSAKKIAWHQLLVEMCAGAIIFYFFVVEQLGIVMTPPRSEAWAVCAGAAIALAYFCVRTSQYAALRVGIYAGLGAGFGFAFGDFLFVMGNVSGIKFNFWNVMEYSLGFFGGIGMAYGAFSGSFEEQKEESAVAPSKIYWPVFGLMALIPFIVWQQTFWDNDVVDIYKNAVAENPEFWSGVGISLAFLTFLITMICGFFISGKWEISNDTTKAELLNRAGIILFASYLIYTFLITGSYLSFYRPEQFLYLVNFAVILFLIPRCISVPNPSQSPSKVALPLLLGVVAVILLLSAVSILFHDGLPGAQPRF